MGSNSSSGGSGGGNNTIKQQKKNKFTDLTKENLNPSDDTKAKMDLFINDPYTKKQGGPIVLRPFEPFFDKSAKATRQFFTNKVLESKKAKKNIGYTKDEFSKLSRTKQEEVYKGYMSKRMSNETDAYGNKITSTGGGNQVVTAPTEAIAMSPTEAEVSQSSTAQATPEEDIILRKRKTKARGRSPTIMSGVAGVTGGLTLGKPSLLGS